MLASDYRNLSDEVCSYSHSNVEVYATQTFTAGRRIPKAEEDVSPLVEGVMLASFRLPNDVLGRRSLGFPVFDGTPRPNACT